MPRALQSISASERTREQTIPDSDSIEDPTNSDYVDESPGPSAIKYQDRRRSPNIRPAKINNPVKARGNAKQQTEIGPSFASGPLGPSRPSMETGQTANARTEPSNLDKLSSQKRKVMIDVDDDQPPPSEATQFG